MAQWSESRVGGDARGTFAEWDMCTLRARACLVAAHHGGKSLRQRGKMCVQALHILLQLGNLPIMERSV